jgi:hypothetical protein
MAKRQRRRRQRRRDEHANRRGGWNTHHSVITGAAMAAGGMLGVVQPALADNFTVNAGGDAGDGVCQDVATGDCTLRDAVYSSNADSNYSYISFASNVTGTITLDGAIGINYGTFIYGPEAGPDALTVSGDDNSGIFNASMTNTGDPLYIGALTLADGYQIVGGAIYNENASLSVNNAVLTGNYALAGGAIYEHGGYDGGYYTSVTFSTLTGNDASYGGAFFSNGYFGLIGASTFQGNQSKYGGAVDAPNAGTTFNGSIFDSTISGNAASESGGGLFTYAAQSVNTIIGNNAGPQSDVSSAYFYGYYDLIRTPDGTTINGENNLTGADPQLFALADNGGYTPTMKPAPTSPVVDAGHAQAPIDQRLSDRPVDNPLVANSNNGNASDIGSVELSLGEGPQPPATPQPPVATKKKCKKKKKKHHSAESAKKKKRCKRKKRKHRSARVAAEKAISTWRAEARSADSPRAGRPRSAPGRGSELGGWADQAWRIRH